VSGFFVPHDLPAPIVGAPTGPLAGLTCAVKDLFDIAGTRTGGGNPDWLAAQRPAASHAGAVKKLLDAGTTIIGKTICDEFFYSVTGANAHYGTPANLRAPGRMPGGSSSGSAAATAAGACDFALGSDTGGSVRVPASFCGLYGIRPTFGRVDLSGAMLMAHSFDTVGWFANGPGVFHRVGTVLLDDTRVASLVNTLIIADDAFEQADTEVSALLKTYLERAADVMPAPNRMRIAPNGFESWREAVRILQAHEIWTNYGEFIMRAKPKFGPGIKERMAFAATVSKNDADASRRVQDEARRHIRTLIPAGTVLAIPTVPCIAPLLDTPADALESFRMRVMRLTCIAGLSGLPQVSVPIGTVSGRPVGLSFVGWAGGDEALLDLAVKWSRICGAEG
jgi:amidase